MIGQHFKSLINDLTGELCVRFWGKHFKKDGIFKTGKLYDLFKFVSGMDACLLQGDTLI